MRIAAVSRDPEERLQLARAFDDAPASWLVSLHEDVPADADVIVCGPTAEIEGAVAVDPATPERVIADLKRHAESRSTGRRIFVVGATGGSGSTTLALHLAAAGRACVIETRGSGIRRRLGFATARSWSTDEGDGFGTCALPVAPGFKALLAPPDPPFDDVKRVVGLASAAFPAVIVDCGHVDVERLSVPGDAAVIVMPPTRPAAERAKELLEIGGPRWALVTNRLGPGGCLTRRRLEALSGRRIAIELPCCAALRDAEDEGALLTSPFSPWLWKVKKLWRALETA